MELRECSTCCISKPLTLEYFVKNRGSRLGYATQCKVCQKSYYQEWYKKNKKHGMYKQKSVTLAQRGGGGLYTIKMEDPEEQKQRLSRAYEQIYRNAFNTYIDPERLQRIVNDDT
jgi:hypothetical protein